MATQVNDVRISLFNWLQRQGNEYSEAIRLMELLQRQQSLSDANAQKTLAKLQAVIDRIAGIEVHLEPLREQYRLLGKPVTPELQQLLDQQEELLKQFIAKTDVLQNGFAVQKTRMLPELDGNVRRRTMQDAYKRSMRTG
jgi:hypothetical protein